MALISDSVSKQKYTVIRKMIKKGSILFTEVNHNNLSSPKETIPPFIEIKNGYGFSAPFLFKSYSPPPLTDVFLEKVERLFKTIPEILIKEKRTLYIYHDGTNLDRPINKDGVSAYLQWEQENIELLGDIQAELAKESEIEE